MSRAGSANNIINTVIEIETLISEDSTIEDSKKIFHMKMVNKKKFK